jgi:hypothetical protein
MPRMSLPFTQIHKGSKKQNSKDFLLQRILSQDMIIYVSIYTTPYIILTNTDCLAFPLDILSYFTLFSYITVLYFNPFQSNFSATRILPSSYLFWAGKWMVDCLSVLHEEKSRTGSDSGAGEQTQQENVSDVFRHWSGTGKSCRMRSDVGSERVNMKHWIIPKV